MQPGSYFKQYASSVTFRSDRYGKATLFENENILVGLNCLEPGQAMEKHAHVEQNRFYLVLEGCGQVRVGEEEQSVQAGTVVWVPAGCAHRLFNHAAERWVLLVGISPAKAD